MTLPSEATLQKLQFYVTTSYPCGYLPGKRAQSLIATPQHLIDSSIYNGLIQEGFRRSGKFAYRPHCENCNACTPVRLLVEEFTPTRSQKRCLKHHQNLQVNILPLAFHADHFELYNNYQTARHNEKINGSHANIVSEDKVSQYRDFLVESNVETLLIEFRLGGALKMVSVVDVLRDGISAVYTFYKTDDLKTSYGTFNIVWLNGWTRSLGLTYLYLGYWIKDSQKMAYKQKFKPQQALIDGEWKIFNQP